MEKSASQVIQDAIFSATVEVIGAFKSNSGGMPNVMVRDLDAVHANTSFDTLPDAVQHAIKGAVQDTLKRLQREGYMVGPKTGAISRKVRG